MKYHELMFRLLLLIAGATISNLNLTISATLADEPRKAMTEYSESLRNELSAVTRELRRM